MADAFTAFLLALGIVFLAEMGDKTQFAVLAMAGRGHPWRVLSGAAVAFTILAFAAALIGDWVGDRVPLEWIAVAAGLVFIALGILAWRDRDEDRADGARPGFVAALLLVLAAEMGDRTQIAVVALAARNGHPWATGAGAALALMASAGVAVWLGRILQDRVPARLLKRIVAILFIAVGITFVLAPFWRRVV